MCFVDLSLVPPFVFLTVFFSLLTLVRTRTTEGCEKYHNPHHVQHAVNKFRTLGVVALRPIVTRPRLAKDEIILGPEKYQVPVYEKI